MSQLYVLKIIRIRKRLSRNYEVQKISTAVKYYTTTNLREFYEKYKIRRAGRLPALRWSELIKTKNRERIVLNVSDAKLQIMRVKSNVFQQKNVK